MIMGVFSKRAEIMLYSGCCTIVVKNSLVPRNYIYGKLVRCMIIWELLIIFLGYDFSLSRGSFPAGLMLNSFYKICRHINWIFSRS